MTLHFDRQKAANEVKMRNLMFCTKTAVKDVKCKFWEENWTRGRFEKCMFTSHMGECGWDKLSRRPGCSNSSHCDTETRWSSKAELKILLLHLVRRRMCWSWTCSSAITQFSIRLRPQPLLAIIIISSKSSACISLSAKDYVFNRVQMWGLKHLSLWLAGGEKMWMWVIGADIVHLAAAVYYPMWGPGPILILGQIHKFSRKSRKSQSRKYLKTSKGELFLLFSSSKLCQPSHSSR